MIFAGEFQGTLNRIISYCGGLLVLGFNDLMNILRLISPFELLSQIFLLIYLFCQQEAGVDRML